MNFYKQIVGENYLDLFGNLEIMSMPSSHEDINATFGESNEITFDEDEQTDEVDINDGMGYSEQPCKQDDFLSFINLNNNINLIINNDELSDDNFSETDSFDEYLINSDEEDNEGKYNVFKII